MHLPAPLVHAKYLHGVPSESIPAAVSVLSLSGPCGAVVCPSELPLTRPRDHLWALISALGTKRASVGIDLGSMPPKGPFFAHFFGSLQVPPGTPLTPLVRGWLLGAISR